MRFVGLYLRSRMAGWALLILALLAPVSWAVTYWMISRPGVGVEDFALYPILSIVTAAVACVLAVSTHSPFGDVERTVARPLPPLRLGHLCGLLIPSALLLAAVLLTFDLTDAHPPSSVLALLRNLAGFTGFALLGARLLGARLAWIAPLLAIFASPWHRYSGTDANSWTLVLAALATGLLLVCLQGPRQPREDAG